MTLVDPHSKRHAGVSLDKFKPGLDLVFTPRAEFFLTFLPGGRRHLRDLAVGHVWQAGQYVPEISKGIETTAVQSEVVAKIF